MVAITAVLVVCLVMLAEIGDAQVSVLGIAALVVGVAVGVARARLKPEPMIPLDYSGPRFGSGPPTLAGGEEPPGDSWLAAA